MVKAICIDDKNKPPHFRQSKWLKEGQEYEIIYTCMCLPQKEVGVILAEIELGDEELPIEYFLLRRFAFTEENLLKLLELIKNCTETDFSLTELLEQTQLQEA